MTVRYGSRCFSSGYGTPFSDDIEQLLQWKSVHTNPGEVLELRENVANQFELVV